jgi:hypothetical protein
MARVNYYPGVFFIFHFSFFIFHFFQMDKIIWLRVIKQELGLLEQLAIGMIDDVNLSKEEVELAISRSKIVVREFEMLLDQIPVLQSGTEYAVHNPQSAVHIPQAAVSGSPGPYSAVHSPQSAVPDPPRPMAPPIPPVYSLEAEQDRPPSDFYRLEREEQSILNLEEKKEEPTHFKALPLKSLKEGLLLNDRYLFQRELFHDDKSRLDETIAALDRLKDIHEAVEYLKANFRWTKSEASEKFVQLVKRRFS